MLPSIAGSPRPSALDGEGRLITAGLVLLGFSFVAHALRDAILFNHWVNSAALAAAATLLYGMGSVIGIILLTIADVDINQFLRRHQIRLIIFVAIWAASLVVIAYAGAAQVQWYAYLPLLPWILLAVRYKSVVEMEPGSPLFTDLFICVLVLNMFTDTISLARLALDSGGDAWYTADACAFAFAAVATLAVAYHYAPSRRSTGTAVQLKATTYTYMLSFGVAIAIGNGRYEQFFSTPTARHQQALTWVVVAVRVLPPAIMLLCRERAMRGLGLRWLLRRGANSSNLALFQLQHTDRRGDLVEVENEITLRSDLNRMVLHNDPVTNDDYTLLHLAVLNSHLDALQRLLHTGAVEINKRTGRRGRSALFIAAEIGSIHAVRMLLEPEHRADVDALSDEGQSPLIVAAAGGHREVVALLEKEGASKEHRWMGLKAEDVMRGQGVLAPLSNIRESSGSTDDPVVVDTSNGRGVVDANNRAGQGRGRTATQRVLVRGDPGYNRDSLDSDVSSRYSSAYTSRGDSDLQSQSRSQSRQSVEMPRLTNTYSISASTSKSDSTRSIATTTSSNISAEVDVNLEGGAAGSASVGLNGASMESL